MQKARGLAGDGMAAMTPGADRLVSVVIPSYNHGRFLGHAIRSALDQTYGAVEVIVVDDGSTDGSQAVVARCQPGVHYVRQDNRGLPAARNTGIRAARGAFVGFLDADDVWLPGFLSAVMDRWDRDPTLGAIHTGFYCMDEDGRRLPQISTSVVADDRMFDRLVDGEFFVPSSVVARRECFDRVGLFDEALRGSEDWDMWLRVARQCRFAGIAEPLIRYRVHGSNMSGDPEYMLRYQRMVVAKHFGEALGPAHAWPLDRQRAYAAVYRYASQGHYLRGDLAQSEHYLRLALEANPALCGSVDLFYELACADQPLGRRCTEARGDFDRNGAFLLSSLNRIFSAPDLPARLQGGHGTAVAHACLALGLLAYGRGRPDRARVYLSKALVTDRRMWRNRLAWSTLAKSMLGRRLLRFARARVGQGGPADSEA
jgi:glycosyltransferase involved in cell wall biosynthesis